MDACGIQRIVSVQNAHETRALFKCLGPQLSHLKKLFPVGEASVGLPVINDIPCNCFIDPGYVFQQGSGCRIQIHTHLVHTVLNHAA